MKAMTLARHWWQPVRSFDAVINYVQGEDRKAVLSFLSVLNNCVTTPDVL